VSKTSVRRVAGFGLISGVAFGVVIGLIFQNVWFGVGGGVFYGLFMAIGLRHLWGSTALRGLSPKQRRQVMRTLRRGEPTNDPDLMIPLVDQGKVYLRQPFHPKVARVGLTLTFLFGGAAAGISVADEGLPGLLDGGPLMLFSLVMIFGVIPRTARTRERVAHSIAATEQILASRVREELRSPGRM
jgi:hypothetical protein